MIQLEIEDRTNSDFSSYRHSLRHDLALRLGTMNLPVSMINFNVV